MRMTLIPRPIISIHAPARGATYDYFSIWHCVTFQSTHPRGCDQGKSAFSRLPSYFNPRTREGCDILHTDPLVDPGEFQSTHPRGVRLIYNLFGSLLYKISIHAPARGATRSAQLQHLLLRNFNPRTREGCDEARLLVSTANADFNPRTREGCDCIVLQFQSFHQTFQSTHPRGVRPRRQGCHPQPRDFNPRTREGCDRADVPLYDYQEISIHAPARGATLKVCDCV